MKRKTCKRLLGLGIVWVFFLFIILLYNVRGISADLFINMIIIGIPAWILIAVAWTKWNSEEVKIEESRIKIKENSEEPYMIN